MLRKYVSSVLTLLLTLLLIASINQISSVLYEGSNKEIRGNSSGQVASLKILLGLQNSSLSSQDTQTSYKNGPAGERGIGSSQSRPRLQENQNQKKDGSINETQDFNNINPNISNKTGNQLPWNLGNGGSLNGSLSYNNTGHPPSQLFPKRSDSNDTVLFGKSEFIDLRKNSFCRGDTETIVMTVKGAAHTAYLRGGVYVKYQEGIWYSLNDTSVPGNRGILPSPRVEYTTVSDSITVTMAFPIEYGNLFTALYTEEVNAPVPLDYHNKSHLFEAKGIVWEYSFETVHYLFPEEALNSAVASGSEEYLQVPEVSERVIELAYNITRGIESDYQKAKAIETYLKTHYEYDREAPPAPENIDPLDWFLFYSKRGVCIDFNTAFVILARLNGIPARLVTGYMIRRTPKEQVVNLHQAHAWAEVHFDGIGWITFDATASGSLGGVSESSNETSSQRSGSSPSNATQSQARPYPQFYIKVEPNPVTTSVNQSFFVNITVVTQVLPVIDNCKPVFRVSVDMNGLYTVQSTLPPNTTRRLNLWGISEPGIYHPTVTATLTYCGVENTTKKQTFTVIVEGGMFSLDVIPRNLTLTTGDIGRLKVYVTGKNYRKTVYLKVDYPFRYRLVDNSRVPDFDTILLVVAPDEVGDYMIKIEGISGNLTSVLYVPLKVMGITKTVITSYPNEIIKGSPFTVNGTVMDSHGNPVNGIVYVTLNETKNSPGIIIGRGIATNGRFSVECRLPPDFRPGEYQIIAHFEGTDYYLPSNSDPTIIVRDKTSIEAPEEILRRTGEFQLGGTLVDSTGKGIANAIIEVSVDGIATFNVTTDAAGIFTAPILIESPGGHHIVLSYRGDRYYLGATAEVNLTAVELDVNVPERWIIGQNVTVRGSVLGVSSGDISLSTPMGLFNASLTSGEFNFTVPVNASPGRYNIFFTYESVPLETVRIVIASPTNITVQFGDMHVGKNSTVIVRLVDVFGNPLPGKKVHLSLFGEHEGRTDQNGTVLFVIKPNESGEFTGFVAFKGDDFYLSSHEKFTVSVASNPPYLLILVATLFVPLGTVVYKKRNEIGATLWRLKERRYTLTLSFDRQPPIYEEGEKIPVKSETQVELFVDGKSFGSGKTFELMLPKGVHELLATGKDGRGRAKVWVVDYREEIIRLYDECFLELARQKGLGRRDLTPEEIALRLGDEYNWEDLRKVTYFFEVARYSLYPVGRKEFMEFYQALSRIVGGGYYGEES